MLLRIMANKLFKRVKKGEEEIQRVISAQGGGGDRKTFGRGMFISSSLSHTRIKPQMSFGRGMFISSSLSHTKVKPQMPLNVKEITKYEAASIGKKFAMFLLTTTEPTAAVQAWKLDQPKLNPFFDQHPFFVPMMNQIAKVLLANSKLGLKWRVGLGAGLSIMDMISDTGVINSYRASGNTAGAYSLMAMIGSNMAVQLLITYMQNKKKSKWVILREFAFVVTFLKPAVDAYRVATGHKDDDTLMNPLVEMSCGKGVELAFESIPGGLLQAYVFINAPEKTVFLLISILISTLATGFSSAMISYDMDISVANRKEVPLFYGYIKDGNTERMITFILQVSEWSAGGGCGNELN